MSTFDRQQIRSAFQDGVLVAVRRSARCSRVCQRRGVRRRGRVQSGRAREAPGELGVGAAGRRAAAVGRRRAETARRPGSAACGPRPDDPQLDGGVRGGARGPADRAYRARSRTAGPAGPGGAPAEDGRGIRGYGTGAGPAEAVSPRRGPRVRGHADAGAATGAARGAAPRQVRNALSSPRPNRPLFRRAIFDAALVRVVVSPGFTITVGTGPTSCARGRVFAPAVLEARVICIDPRDWKLNLNKHTIL